jgi:hypothetical protein
MKLLIAIFIAMFAVTAFGQAYDDVYFAKKGSIGTGASLNWHGTVNQKAVSAKTVTDIGTCTKFSVDDELVGKQVMFESLADSADNHLENVYMTPGAVIPKVLDELVFSETCSMSLGGVSEQYKVYVVPQTYFAMLSSGIQGSVNTCVSAADFKHLGVTGKAETLVDATLPIGDFTMTTDDSVDNCGTADFGGKTFKGDTKAVFVADGVTGASMFNFKSVPVSGSPYASTGESYIPESISFLGGCKVQRCPDDLECTDVHWATRYMFHSTAAVTVCMYRGTRRGK